MAVLQRSLTIRFSWVSPSAEYINGILLGYQLTCTALNKHKVALNVSGTSVSLTQNLQQDTHYTCTVCAYTIVGCGPSGTVHISTYKGCKLFVYYS